MATQDNKNQEIKNRLLTAGIPAEVFGTTLIKEGHTDIREWMQRRGFRTESEDEGTRDATILVYPSTPKAYARARKVFYLMAKEMLLAHFRVYRLPLISLHDALNTDEGDRILSKIGDASFVFVSDFFEAGTPLYLEPFAAARIRSWVKARMEDGKGLVVMSDRAPQAMSIWWPEHFLTTLVDKATKFEIAER